MEEWTYPTPALDIVPAGMFTAPVKVDGEGMSAIDLERVLSTWDESARKAKRCVIFSLHTSSTHSAPVQATCHVYYSSRTKSYGCRERPFHLLRMDRLSHVVDNGSGAKEGHLRPLR